MKFDQLPTWIALLGLCLLGACAEDEREVTTTSDLAYAAYEEGRGHIERFQLEEGREEFLEAVELDPEFSMAWLQLGIVQRQLGDREAATASLDRAHELSTNATEVEALYIARLHALFERDMETAQSTWETLKERYPDHPWVLRMRAEFAKADNDFETAHACYDRLLEKDPEAVAVHNLKGYLYLSQGQYDLAVLSLQRYAYYTEDEDNPQANPHDSLGEAYLYIGRYEEAIEEFQAALEIDPAFLWSARNLANALSITGQNRAAVKVLEHIRPVFDERDMMPWWHMTRSQISMRAENWSELVELATADIERLAEVDEDRSLEYELFARYAQTLGLLELGELDAARATLDELSAVAQKIEHYGAEAELERPRQWMEINEAMTISHFARAEGRPAEGIERLENAIESTNFSPHELAWPSYELAEAYLVANQPAQAAAVADRILDAIPTAPGLNYIAARAYASLGERELALEHLRTYLEVMRKADPGLEQVEEASSLLQQLVPRS